MYVRVAGESSLGCSVVEINGLAEHWSFTVDDSFGDYDQPYDLDGMRPYTEEGVRALKKFLGNDDTGGIAIWVDTSANTSAYSGKGFYELLKRMGENVAKSKSYKNPNHEGRCTLYYWFFRRRVKSNSAARPVQAIRRKEVEKKAKAA